MKGDLKVTFKIIEFYGIDRILQEAKVKLLVEQSYRELINEVSVYSDLTEKDVELKPLSLAIGCLIAKLCTVGNTIKDNKEANMFFEVSCIKEYTDAVSQYCRFKKKENLLQCAEKIRENFKNFGL